MDFAEGHRPLCKCHEQPMGRNGPGKWLCLVKRRESNRAWREANPDKFREALRSWRESNVDKIRERERLYYAANREKIKERSLRHYWANREKALERHRRWNAANYEHRWRYYIEVARPRALLEQRARIVEQLEELS